MDTQMVGYGSEEQLERAVVALKLLADATRLKIGAALLHGEHAVNDLAEHVGAQPAAVSQHLAKLRLAGVVDTRREGNHVYYRLTSEHVRRLVMEALFHGERVAQRRPSERPRSSAS